MKNLYSCILFCAALAALVMNSCNDDKTGNGSGNEPGPEPALEPLTAVQTDRAPWYDTYPEMEEGQKFSVSTEPIKLEFYGWGESKDKTFYLEFPEDHTDYERAILTYRMGGWNQGPAAWDMTTMFFVYNKYDDQWYEIVRVFTPYGNSFGPDWTKEFYFDITEYLPMLEGQTQFRVYYGGFDATAERAHTATLTFDLYQGEPERLNVWTAKVYDSSRDDNSAYRGWVYGVEGYNIEGPGLMDEKIIEVPAEVRSLEMRVAISGHGADQGIFIDRQNYSTLNAAEFDYNTYTVKIDGEPCEKTGLIFYSNENNYPQAGTCYYDRANWGPGNPLNVHYWKFVNVPEGGFDLSIDMDLERFRSKVNDPRGEGVAYYIVEADLFGYDR